jgi:hypothetical protein
MFGAVRARRFHREAHPIFADDGLIIVETFPPYIFNGKDAAAEYLSTCRQHFRGSLSGKAVETWPRQLRM